MVTLVLTEVARLLALALPITNGAKGMVSIPLPGAAVDLRPDPHSGFRHAAKPTARLLPAGGDADGAVLCRALPPGEFAHRQALPVAAAERGACLLDRRQHRLSARHRLRHLVLLRRRRRRHLRRHLAVDLSVELHRHRFGQLHAELLPRRPRLRLRPDARHARPLFRLGPPVPDRRIPAADLFDAADRADAGPAERPAQPRLPSAGRRAEP